MRKIISYEKELVKKGVDIVADAVKITLGPLGSNVIIGTQGMPVVTNDGITVASQIFVDNEVEQLGVDMMKQIAFATEQEVGDGTSTSVVLGQAIMNKGFELLNTDSEFGKSKEAKKPIELRHEINKSCENVVKLLKAKAKPVKDLAKIASISAESSELGKIIAKAVEKVGKNGSILIEDGSSFEVELEFTDGLELSKGYVSPYFINSKKFESVYDNAHILMIDDRIDDFGQLEPLNKVLTGAGIGKIVIFAGGYSKDVIANAVANTTKGNFQFLLIENTTYRKDEFLEDLQATVGGKVFYKGKNMDISQVTLEDLGQAGKIISTQNKTIIKGGKGDNRSLVRTLEEVLKGHAVGDFDKDYTKERLSNLTTGVAVIKVGAKTDAEREYLTKKIEDAKNATQASLHEGVVAGGGLALKEIANELEDDDILKEALKAPYLQIQENAGGKLAIGKDILDPVKVTRTALEKACSLAGTLLTAGLSIAIKTEKKEKNILDN